MGGNALTRETRRLPADEYMALRDRLLARIGDRLGRLAVPRSYTTKPSHGDLDILCDQRPDNRTLETFLRRTLGAHEVKYNGHVVSFDYDDFQVDLVFTPPDEFAIAQVYYRDNDLNNFIGRIAHKFGLKWGFDGLFYPLRSPEGNTIANILVSRDPEKIYTFLGYDWARAEAGFATLDEIFTYVTSSPYFSRPIFDYANLNGINRGRNKRRANYRLFLEWLDERYPDGTGPIYGYYDDDRAYLGQIATFFPEANLLAHVVIADEREARRKAVAEKFNGHRIMALLPYLEGPRLGRFIGLVREAYPDWDDWILMTEQDQIDATVVHLAIRFQPQLIQDPKQAKNRPL